MQNRKKHNLEIERKKRNKHRVGVVITFAVVGIIVAALAWIAWDVRQSGFAMTFEGTRITRDEMVNYAMLLEANPADPEHRDPIVDFMVHSLTIEHRAASLGIEVSEEEHNNNMMQTFTQRMWGQLPDFISDEMFTNFLNVSVTLRSHLRDHYVPTYTPNMLDIVGAMSEYVEVNRQDYELARTQAQYIVSSDFAAINEVAELINLAPDLGELIAFDVYAQTICEFYDLERGIETASIPNLINWFGLFEATEELHQLQRGERSDILQFGENEEGEPRFILVYVIDRPGIEDSELEESFLEQHVDDRRWELFGEIEDAWVAEANYTVNNRAFR